MPYVCSQYLSNWYEKSDEKTIIPWKNITFLQPVCSQRDIKLIYCGVTSLIRYLLILTALSLANHSSIFFLTWQGFLLLFLCTRKHQTDIFISEYALTCDYWIFNSTCVLWYIDCDLWGNVIVGWPYELCFFFAMQRMKFLRVHFHY